MTDIADAPRVVSYTRDIAAEPATILELIAEPVNQPRWDGNDNLSQAEPGQRVRGVGDAFTMATTKGNTRVNHVVEFEECRRIAWLPAPPDANPPGHLWRWELEPIGQGHTRVTHTYDWSQLTDARRIPRALATTAESLRDSVDRLADLAERGSSVAGD